MHLAKGNTLKRLQPFLLGVLLLLTTAAAHAEQGDTVSLLFAGDVVLDGKPGEMIAQGQDPFAAFSAIFEQADIRIVNLECVVATGGTAENKNFTFRAHPRTLDFLKRHVDAVSNANNHSGDFGAEAFVEMLDLLDQQKIAHFGGGRNLSEAHRPLIIERKGMRIALLGYNEFMPRSFEANAKVAGVAWSEDEQVVLDIKNARQRDKADIVIPFMHWGWENETKAGPRQRQLARLMIAAGADAVIGGHPHVNQDVETYEGKPIIYSLGNFIMDSLDNELQTRGWVLRLEINRSGVQAWGTVLAKISDNGIPAPLLDVKTPCWTKVGDQLGMCLGVSQATTAPQR
jgi:poly-gamma-glutamate capsule biosynthesis protein CapA/YwtB (metallophosphatase superfamily)